MRLLLAGPAHVVKDAYTPLLRSAHRIVATATTLAALRTEAARERQQIEGVLIGGALDTPAALADVLRELQLPAALLAPADWDTTALAAVPQLALLEPTLSWPVAAAALEALLPTAPTPAPTAPARTVAPPVRPDAARPAAAPSAAPRIQTPASQVLVLHPALGGVGASTLALTLAAAGAAAGLESLAVTADVFPLPARLGFPPTERGQIRQVGPHFSAVAVEGEWAPPATYDLIAWDMWRGSEDLVRRWPVLIITRPTGDGKLAAVQAAHELRHLQSTVAGICLVGRGTLTLDAFTRACQEYRVTAPVWALPDDPEVFTLNETEGHGLHAPHYGAAVTRLARQLWATLPWPALEGCLSAAPTAVAAAARPRRKLIEVVD